MAEELNDHLNKWGISTAYIHSDVQTLDRIKILDDLRAGIYDVLVGVNLLREGLDLPQVSLVAILDADKEGFLRNHRSLTQTAGRAARNVNGKVIMYADKITESMQLTIDETERRRMKQMKYNEKHGITPTQIVKNISPDDLLELYGEQKHAEKEDGRNQDRPLKTARSGKPVPYIEGMNSTAIAAEPVIGIMSRAELERHIQRLTLDMQNAAKNTDFIQAAQFRDELLACQEKLNLLTKAEEA